MENVHLLLEQARQSYLYFEEKELRSGKEVDCRPKEDWLKFRGIVYDLYSVLDYVYYLLYCHFSNKGEPDLSQKSVRFGFPSKPFGVKTSDSSKHDQQKRFVRERLNSLWGNKVHIGKETHFWSEIGEIILKVQPKLMVDRDGARAGGPQISTEDEVSFALLRFYRNCVTHKDLIRFKFVPKSWVEINQSTEEVKLVKKCLNEKDCKYYELTKPSYWLHIPEAVTGKEKGGEDRLLLEVLCQLIRFVKRTSSKLLCASLLLPPARVILRDHIQGSKVEKPKFESVRSMWRAEVLVTVSGENLRSLSSEEHKLKADAEEDACICLLHELATKKILPNAPYSHFTLHLVQPCPPVQILEKTDKTYSALMDEYEQCLTKFGIELKQDYTGPDEVTDKYQHYRASVILSIVRGSTKLLWLESSEHEECGKESAKQAALGEVVEECARLGIIQLQ